MSTPTMTLRRPPLPSKEALAAIAAGATLIAIGFTIANRRTRRQDTRTALAGSRGLRVIDAIRLEQPIDQVFSYWRRLENLPTFMSHLVSVVETSPTRSHWVATGPAGLTAEWDAEIINEIENKLIAWRSLPGSEVVTAGSVNFDAVRAGRSTQITVNLQYDPPAGKAGAVFASLFGQAASQTIREDLRKLKMRMEAGEIACAVRPSEGSQR